MKCAFASDLHLEFSAADRRALSFPEDVDVIVLAGDISIGKHATKEVLDLSRRYRKAQIVSVAGNHEFYRRNIFDELRRCRSKDHERIHFLENEAVEINGITFLGCTLWTDFSIFGEAEKCAELAAGRINDFSLIGSIGREFTPGDAAELFKESRDFLESQLAVCDPATTVVVTHFAPGIETRNMNFKADGLTAYFQANVGDLIDKYQPHVWIYGHNHYSNDFYRGKTRLVSNQLGYPGEAGYIPKYDPEKVILLGSSK